MAFASLGIGLPDGLPEGWQVNEEAVRLLASAIGGALAEKSDEGLLPFARVAAELEAAGNDDWARLVVQALLIQLTRRKLTQDVDLSTILFETSTYTAMLKEIVDEVDVDHPLLRAATLTVAGRVAIDESDHLLAAEVFHAAAGAWLQLGHPTEAASVLMGRSAALHYGGDVDAAERAIELALRAYDELGDQGGRAALMLNNVQNALANDDLDTAHARLKAVRPLVRELRDGHITSGYKLHEAAVFVHAEAWGQARSNYLAVAQSARRRDDLEQLIIARKNLAKLTSEQFSHQRGIEWWQKARDAAREGHDWREEQDIERALGVHLAEAGRFSDAEGAFQRALAINDRFGNTLALAQTRADLGAVLLSWASAERKRGDVERAVGLLNRAEETIGQARNELEVQRDYDWAGITVRNLRSAWAAGDHPQEGVDALLASATSYADMEPDYSAELLRNAAMLELGSLSDSDSYGPAVGWLTEATLRQNITLDQRAWALAGDAALLSERLNLHDAALQLFDVALSQLRPEEQPTAWGNIQNDAALAALGADDMAGARRRLQEVEILARATQDRALLALATLNQGELAVRSEENGRARALFEESARLFEALGDIARAAETWASISNAWVDDGDLIAAAGAADRAFDLASESDSGDARARANSAKASISYANSDFENAYALWTESASLVEDRDAGEYQAFALDCLAQLSDWRRFKRELDKLGSQAQKNSSQFVFVDKLHLAGLTWLRGNRPRAAGVVLAYTVVLALDGASKANDDDRIGDGATPRRMLFKLANTFGVVRAFMSLDYVNEASHVALRREYERTIHRIAKDSAQEIVELVDRFALDDNDVQ